MPTYSSVKMEIRRGAAMLAGASRESQRDAASLLCRALGKDRAWILAHPDVILTPTALQRFSELLNRRAKHEPMQYILGEQEFYGLRFEVSPAVLIPRPETEHLVEAALACWPVDTPARVADVGTGSGAIAIALAHERPLFEITAIDLSPQALQIAERNAQSHQVSARVRFLESDLLEAVAGDRFNIIVSNPPYVPSAEQLELQVSAWEPHGALFAGEDGLAIYRRLIPQAKDLLLPGGWLLLEIGYGQRLALTSLLTGWQHVHFVDDLQGIARVAIARR